MQIVTLKFLEIYQNRAMCKNNLILLCNWSSMDVKFNNLSFGDPYWMIPVREETLEP